MKILVLIFLLFWSSGSTFCAALSPDGLTLLAFKSAVSAIPLPASPVGTRPTRTLPVAWSLLHQCTRLLLPSRRRAHRLRQESLRLHPLRAWIPRLPPPSEPPWKLPLRCHSSSAVQCFVSTLSLPLLEQPLWSSSSPLCDLPRLQNLDLSRNSLSGPIPGELRRCRQLQRLHLAGNRLSGEMPAGIWQQMENLLELDLSSNNLTGTLRGGERRRWRRWQRRSRGTLVAIDKGFSCELEELLRASAYVLGKGGMGIMYKVVLGNGVPVAVRRLGDGGAAERRREFASEVMAVARVRHPSLVRLKAYYWSPEEKLLVSEFISNGCLAAALHPKPGEASLSWPDRLRIAKGTARGLAHIHESGPRKLVHGGVKPSNILLDGDLNPHISDLGLARLAHAAGGGSGSRPSQSWDVYAFGVVLLELLTGRSPGGSNQAAAATSSSPVTAMETGELATWARKEVEEGRPPAELVDPAIRSEAQQSRKAVASMLHLALICSELEPNSRPRMRTVSEKLDKIAA
ncbi:unnamed protein product [Spirodela intermedia]|uniref:Protein kinase domain-containing protein n=1 Tax=Spirodela intermedia TaxID=51605 RepID=A0A7I8J180_SPIIN|nr:unnamed protein product [Spirodela intermedia]CAA6663975.1 unnamed protein product [Spirodela intermedia]